MQKVLAICWLTWKAALRFKLFLVIAALLILAVVGLPLVIRDDGTARGFTQIIITYTLSAITVLLGLSTLWLSCGTLARDIEECQMQVVATKPIARWQIWLGKWLGIVTLNAALLAISGACVYGLLQWRATKLPPAEQVKLRSEVLVARGSAKPADVSAEIDADVEQRLQEALKQNPHMADMPAAEKNEAIKQIREQVKAEYQVVPPAYAKGWKIDLGFAKNFLKGKPLQLRVKFNAAQKTASGTYAGIWQIGVPGTGKYWQSEPMSLAADTFHEFQIPPNLFDENGVMTIAFLNENNTALLFPLDDGMEVLYPKGSFEMNLVRGLGIIFCWLALIAALGLMAASFLTFPVATFFCLAMLAVVASSSTLAEAIDAGTVMAGNSETGEFGSSAADAVLIPMFKGMVAMVSVVKDFSPIDALSTGRSIPWTELGLAFGKIIFLAGGFLAVLGIIFFSRRELATAQGTQ
ncbi:MAG TPA: ABC transporter permease [Verrucomicrobiae bacterium]|nr:ABC transporter permease [Verrucomicrobiae bacterium]